MKESMSVTTIFQIVILFILLFTAIMALTINNSNAFGIKDQIVSILEANGGNYIAAGVLNPEIVDLIGSTSYRTTGKCGEDFIGFDRTGAQVSENQEASVCIKEIDATSGLDNYLEEILGDTVAKEDSITGKYYQIVVFFQLDLPIVKQVYNFESKAETKIMYQR